VNFSNKLNSFGKIFIDLIDNNSNDKQGRVISELEKSDLLLLIKTPSILNSEWVTFELETAKNNNIPVIRFSIDEIDNLTKVAIGKKLLTIKT
jgi:hypothetical protein